MAVRPEVVALLADFDVERTSSGERFVHRDRKPFTAAETELIVSATDEEMRAAASELAGTTERLAELFMPYIRGVAGEMSDHPPATGAPLSPRGQRESEEGNR
jgi:hypothetical protein